LPIRRRLLYRAAGGEAGAAGAHRIDAFDQDRFVHFYFREIVPALVRAVCHAVGFAAPVAKVLRFSSSSTR